jgi:hypothetical protein
VRCSELDPFQAAVDRLLGEGTWSAVVILRAIQAEEALAEAIAWFRESGYLR